MRTTISIDDNKLEALLEAAGTDNMTKALNLAADAFIRLRAIERLRARKGKVDILDNDEIELAAVEEDELAQLD
ncbi:MAG: hypothetical protein AAF267_05375 [Deinococcota bacterium]